MLKIMQPRVFLNPILGSFFEDDTPGMGSLPIPEPVVPPPEIQNPDPVIPTTRLVEPATSEVRDEAPGAAVETQPTDPSALTIVAHPPTPNKRILKWDFRTPPVTAACWLPLTPNDPPPTDDDTARPRRLVSYWKQRAHELATFPHISQINIISKSFPWIIEIHSRHPSKGVRCSDIVEGLHAHFLVHLICTDTDHLQPEEFEQMSRAFKESRRNEQSVMTHTLTAGKHPGLLRVDWLGQNTMFGGLERDEEYVKERLGVYDPSYFVLRCNPS